jgi:hypothetical protein
LSLALRGVGASVRSCLPVVVALLAAAPGAATLPDCRDPGRDVRVGSSWSEVTEDFGGARDDDDDGAGSSGGLRLLRSLLAGLGLLPPFGDLAGDSREEPLEDPRGGEEDIVEVDRKRFDTCVGKDTK